MKEKQRNETGIIELSILGSNTTKNKEFANECRTKICSKKAEGKPAKREC
jgi:hypothetical protein